MTDFQTVYDKLNKQQQDAVNYIEGPLLVIAGPGTGKTQLLSTRVAHILRSTDTLPENILCLTFTDAAALNMRERLNTIIGDAAYDVQIATYHSFGSEIIRSYPDYFVDVDLDTGEDFRLERPIDELTKTQILTELILKLPFDDPLRSATYYIGSVDSTISDLKRANTSPEQLSTIAKENLQAVQELSAPLNEALQGVSSVRKFEKLEPIIDNVLTVLGGSENGLAQKAHQELTETKQEADSTNSSKPFTAWRNTWITKDDTNQFVFTDPHQHLKLLSVAKIYTAYQEKLKSESLYDFDDMILRTIDALENNAELKNNVQEKYQYILLDEFQDTNKAQFKMVDLIAQHPVHEGRPNIMAVGDDDQAIYAFQGAEVSNMVEFTKKYRDTLVINLKKNYRSHHDIITTAHNIGSQIETRLEHVFSNIDKQLEAAQTNLPDKATIERHEFSSQASEYAWIAHRAKKLIESGVKPHEIAVLSPKHANLEALVPCMNAEGIPVAYEKRENILVTPVVQQLRLMSELVLALAGNNQKNADNLFPQVLSFAFWDIPVETIWRVNWQKSKFSEERSWAEIALEHDELRKPVLFFLSLSQQTTLLPLEYMLDYFCGSCPIVTEEEEYTSPLKTYYFNPNKQDSQTYFEALSYLSIIRSHLRNYQQGETQLLTLSDFIQLFTLYEEAGKPLINSHPVAQDASAVQLQTVYKAKGLEYEYVFLLSLQDDVWGKKSKSNSNKIALPPNVAHIRYKAVSEDERKRLLFVAITRAKHGLLLTSYSTTETGKSTEPIKYLQEVNQEDGSRNVGVLPLDKQRVNQTSFSAIDAYQHIELLWQQRHINFDTKLKDLLQDRLQKYQMSPTHLNSFIDTEYGGPQEFLLNTLLRFPSAPSVDGEYGSVIHASLEWYQNQSSKPSIDDVLQYYTKKIEQSYIPESQLDTLRARGRSALTNYITQNPNFHGPNVETEVDFRKEGVLVNKAHLTGKIDRLEVDKANKTVKIVDFKTGKPHAKWSKELKLLKYEQQLYFYILLIEKSHTYRGYSVESARLEFVEPNTSGKLIEPLVLEFNQQKYEAIQKLIEVVWGKIQSLELPSIESYSPDYKGSMAFQDFLINT